MHKGLLPNKKELGAFYTPAEATRILCDWAIQSSLDNILEPSFGGCGFLEASRDRLYGLGCKYPSLQLFGCDIDQHAFQHLSQKIGPAVIAKHFINSDFLGLVPQDFSIDEFDVIIGNPPYISHHNMSKGQKTLAANLMKAEGFNRQAKASLWAHFILHSLNFLKRGGRMAWILPGSFLNAYYSKDIKEVFAKEFSRVLIVSLGQRLFLTEGTDEATVVVLCDGWKQNDGKTPLEIGFASTLNDLNNIIKYWDVGTVNCSRLGERAGLALMEHNARRYIEIIAETDETTHIGEIAYILIGIVTGQNKFFVINKETAEKYKLEDTYLKPILAKFNLTKGTLLKQIDFTNAVKNDVRCLLVDTSAIDDITGSLKEYLGTFPIEQRDNNRTFEKRGIWHRPNDGKSPDAFFPYMNHDGPRLLLNKARVTSTNTIHRVFFKKGIPMNHKKLAAISILSTYSQLSAEIEGRSYGSGVLKHEPSEAKNISLLMPKGISPSIINSTFQKIDKLLRQNKIEDARSVADGLVLGRFIELHGDNVIVVLRAALEDARLRRRRIRQSEPVPTIREIMGQDVIYEQEKSFVIN